MMTSAFSVVDSPERIMLSSNQLISSGLEADLRHGLHLERECRQIAFERVVIR